MHVKARPTREFLHDAYVKIYTSSRPTMAPEKKKSASGWPNTNLDVFGEDDGQSWSHDLFNTKIGIQIYEYPKLNEHGKINKTSNFYIITV